MSEAAKRAAKLSICLKFYKAGKIFEIFPGLVLKSDIPDRFAGYFSGHFARQAVSLVGFGEKEDRGYCKKSLTSQDGIGILPFPVSDPGKTGFVPL